MTEQPLFDPAAPELAERQDIDASVVTAARNLIEGLDGSSALPPDRFNAEPGSTETELGRTLAERHPSWPQIRLHVFLSAHHRPKDIAGMAKPLQKADIYLYENMLGDDLTPVFQGFADANPSALPATYIDDELDRLSTEEDWDLRGRTQEGIIRALYGSHKIVGHIDLRQPEHALLIAIDEAMSRPPDYSDNFDRCLEGIEDKIAEIAKLTAEREDIMLSRLEVELERIFLEHPELLDRRMDENPNAKRPVEILATLGSAHTTFYHKARGAGIAAERSFSRMPYIHTSEYQAERIIAAGQKPSRDLLAKSYLEEMLDEAVDYFLPADESWTSAEKDKYLRHCSRAFATEEIEQIFESIKAETLLPEDLEKILIDKGLGPIPTSNVTMQNFLQNQHEAETARTAAIRADFEHRKAAGMVKPFRHSSD